ncbi:hypothetical protein TEK04_19580 [Klenkia sp. LSe6-5]|uniref:Bacteriophage HK97-gp10, tail-component n=1 Tax=Klenkia sesuvii TaxID=3103137 RepID=A0ABU8DZ53_9ACTN
MVAGESVGQNARSRKGAEDFVALSKAMKAAGQTELRKELHRAVRQAAKPVIPKVRAAARSKLPARGGLNRRVARKPLRAAVLTGSGSTVGVRIVQGKSDRRLNDSGRLAHPTFGRPRSTVVQQVPGAVGFFDQTIRGQAPKIRADIADVLVDFRDRLAAAVRGGGAGG